MSDHHIVPLPVYFKTFAGLIVLTILTLLTALYVDLGTWNIALALLIAGAKATLVVLFFMQLYYDDKVNRVILITSLITVGLLAIFIVADIWTRIAAWFI